MLLDSVLLAVALFGLWFFCAKCGPENVLRPSSRERTVRIADSGRLGRYLLPQSALTILSQQLSSTLQASLTNKITPSPHTSRNRTSFLRSLRSFLFLRFNSDAVVPSSSGSTLVATLLCTHIEEIPVPPQLLPHATAPELT